MVGTWEKVRERFYEIRGLSDGGDDRYEVPFRRLGLLEGVGV